MKPDALAVCLLIATTIAGCGSTGSVIGETTDSQSVGHYAIPKGLLELNIELRYPKSALQDASALTADNVSLHIKSIEVEFIPAAYIPLEYDPNAFSTDGLTIDVDDRGFLTQVAIDVDDKSAEFIGKLIDIAKLGVKIDHYPATVLTITNDEVKQELHLYVDPYSAEKAIDAIPDIPGDEIKITMAAVGAPMKATSTGDEASTIASSCKNSICYPALVSRLLTLTGPAGTMEEQMVVVPDPCHMIKVDLKRAAAVKKTLTADFSNGVLSKLTLNKPSEALSIASVPFDVLSAIFAIPTELIQLKIDTSEKEKGLLDAQKDLINAQEQLIEAVEKAKQAAAERQDEQGSYD